MKPQNLHAHEDRLLDFVYGELPPTEARAVESHVEGCARCSEMLAGIRGVRTTMAQLPMEPAPDAGLESLLAYAQQAARNAAAGPAPKPTWWRRWLMPAMGVAAVTVFGVISVQVNKALDLKEEVAAQSMATKDAEAPSAKAQLAQVPASPPPPAEYAPEAEAAGIAPGADEGAYPQAATPPPSAPAAKLDREWAKKEAPRAKPSTPGRKGSRSDWSNAGTGSAFGDNEELAKDSSVKNKKAKSSTYESDRRDAMTQAGPFSKPKSILVGSAPAEEPPAQAAMPEPSTADGRVAESEAEVQQQAPAQGSLRVGGSRSRGAGAPPANKPAEDSSDDFDELFGATAKRAPSPAGAPSAPPPTASAAPMPSVSMAKSPAKKTAPAARDESNAEEKRVAVSADLLKQADAARSEGDRVREAQFLRQALAAGATGKVRLGLLNRLCDAEFAIGRRQAAFEACSLVLEEDPRSSAAQVARNRLRREGMEDSDSKAGTGSRGSLRAAPVDKREAPAQAQ
jgi:anti-sigma factor RsiW